MENLFNFLTRGEVMFWVVTCVICFVIEEVTLGLTTIWFSAGAIVALVAASAGLDFFTQFVIFLVVSLVLLIFTRKIFIKKLKTGNTKTNVDALIGRKAVLTEDITAFSVGAVKINGKYWSAVCEDRSSELKAGTEIEVTGIEGVKVIVKKSS